MDRPRLRDLGISIGIMKPGRWNAITDVSGVLVGQVQVWHGEGALQQGKGPARTGVTVIRPHGGNVFRDKVPAAVHVINGFGKSMGLTQIMELGTIETPIVLTNTLNVASAADALISYMLTENPDIGITTGTVNPIVGECNDGFLNDIRGRHVQAEHVLQALQEATPGPVLEGAVGAGTGMSTFDFKGGIGTASRLVQVGDEEFTVGVLVLSNFGSKNDLMIDGAPVGKEIAKRGAGVRKEEGSIMVIVATDTPFDSRQLLRLAKRAGIGIARTGSIASNGSGDFIIAFSTANQVSVTEKNILVRHSAVRDDDDVLALFFRAAIEATEEAVINSILKATTVTGRDMHRREAIPVDEVVAILKEYKRI
jgi:D-aminopeptidase